MKTTTLKNCFSKSLFFLSLVCISMFFVQCKSAEDKQVEESLKQAATMLNTQTPVMIDEITRLDHVVADGKTLIYEATIMNTEGIEPKELEKVVNEAVKTNPQLNVFSKYDVKITYKYVDSDGKDFCQFTVNVADVK